MRTEHYGRIGRTMPSPLYGVLVEVGARDAGPQSLASRWRMSFPREWWLPAALLLALWPHWTYVARRLVDGSDEPWGILALATVAVLLWRERGELVTPPRAALVASGALAVVAALAELVLPDLVAAAIAMLAFGTVLVHALRRPATALVVLLLLALPIIASLQFYLGYPLRLLVAHASALLLSLLGVSATAAGASIVHDGTTVLIDAPCAGIGMLWIGSFVAALLSYLHAADACRTLLNGVSAGLLVLLANIARNVVLYFPESGRVQWPAWSHEVVGLLALAAAIVPLAWLASRRLS
jgi:exosortase/archaeosortase family protein